jgi:CSLREA domain-containing protein
VSDRQHQRRARRRRKHSERSSTRRLVAAGGLTAGATLAMAGVAQAAPVTYTVGTNADDSTGGACTTPANTDCSLREAISLANANTPDADTIVFNSNLTGSTISLTSGELEITEAVDINGPGASNLTLDGGGNHRIFYVEPTTPDDPVAITDMTLTNGDTGSTEQSGGAVENDDADLTLSDDVVSNSYATNLSGTSGPPGTGGGVFTYTGALTIDASTITGNHAYQGGGVGSFTGQVTITDSTLTGNHADGDTTANGNQGYGGGVFTYGGDAIINNSTIDDNVAAYDGGGIYSSQGGSGAAVTLTNSTVANNNAQNDDGGGVWICCGETDDGLTVVDSTVTGNTAATMTGGLQSYLSNESPILENSIVSGNSSGTDPLTDDLYAEPGYEWQASFSLVGVQGPYVNDVAGDVVGAPPRLGPLADNGGPTETRAPLCGSPVIDQGSALSLTEDQRGLTRPVLLSDYPDAAGSDGSDIGAVELQTTPGSLCVTESPNTKNFGDQTVGTGSAAQTFTVTSIGPDPVEIASASLVGADAAQFAKSSDTCSGTTLSTNNSCTVDASFAPSSTGAKAAQLRLTDDAIDSPQNLALSGNGVVTPPSPTPTSPTTTTTTKKKKCKKKKHKRSADSAKKKKCKKKKKK